MLRFSVFIMCALFATGGFSYFHRNNVCQTLQDYKTIYRNKNCSYNPDVGSSPRLIAKRYGYPFENHPVTTEDGYILNLHRIPGSQNRDRSSDDVKRRPILIFHGLAGSSAFWMLRGNKSIAFLLADNGYDVWLGNFRGNYYSDKHVNSSLNEREYWNFGFHEMAIYDLPACIDLIANRTGEKGNLIYVGHSMGTTVSYIYATVKKKHAEDNLKAIVSLAPVAYMKNVMGLFRLLAPIVPLLTSIFRSKGIYALGQHYELQKALLGITCGTYPLIIPCNLLIILSSGLSIKEFQPKLLPVFLSYYPSGSSLKTLKHYAQVITSNGKFPMYDYGMKKNLELYNSTLPPEYDVSQITVPVYLFIGSEDIVGDRKDGDILVAKLNSGKRSAISRKYVLPYAHNDFLLARNIDTFYKTILQVLKT